MLPLLLACAAPPGADVDDEVFEDHTDDPGDDSGTVDSDSPGDPCASGDLDTGIGFSTFGGRLQVTPEVSGRLGYTFYSFRLLEDVGCVLEGTITNEGTAATLCPDCLWSFDMSAIQASTATGICCDTIGWSDGLVDGQWDGDWGFSEYYAYPYNGYYLPLTDVVWHGQDGVWTIFAYNYAWRYLTYGSRYDVYFQSQGAAWPEP